jgi:hypothetical protein
LAPAGVVGALLRSEGELDPSAGQLTLHRRSVDLRTVAVVARVNLGGPAVCWLRYRRRPGRVIAPRLVVCPRPVADRLAAVVRRTDSPPGDRSDRGSNRLVRAVFAACGLGALSLVVAFQLLDAVPRVVALWGSAVFGPFGGLFRWSAYWEG